MECAVRNQEFSKAADAIHIVKALLSQPVYKHEEEIKILSSIETECHIQTQKLICDLSEKWKGMIQWVLPDKTKMKTDDGMRKTELKMLTKGETPGILDELIIGMKKMNILEDKMKKFGENLLQYFTEPMMSYNQVDVTECETGFGVVLSVLVNCDPEKCCPPAPVNMFDNLYKVLRFLNTNLLYVVLDDAKSSTPCTLMSVLGEQIGDKTLELAVKECLIKALPSSSKELELFSNVIKMTDDAHNKLVALNFIPSTNTVLVDYMQNVTVLFANKKCQELQEKARKLMTSEVHNTTIVSHDKPLGELPPLVQGIGGKKPRRDDLAVDSLLSGNTFRLPTCHIR